MNFFSLNFFFTYNNIISIIKQKRQETAVYRIELLQLIIKIKDKKYSNSSKIYGLKKMENNNRFW